MNDGTAFATEKLTKIYGTAASGSEKQLAAIAALGRVGGQAAAEQLLRIYRSAPEGSAMQIAVIQALGEAGRVL